MSLDSLPRLEDLFEVGPEIGRGGMGIVYEGRQKEPDRPVAIKKLAPYLLEEKEFLDRFLQEADAIGRLTHPGIVAIWAVCRDEEGLPCIVMERLRGETLADILTREGHLEPIRAVVLIAQAAEALDSAHRHNIIHRDLKPENLMVVEDGRIEVMDFGLARMEQKDRPRSRKGHTVYDSPDLVWGSYPYMSPEHADLRTVDARSDIYSLGIVLYHALTGRTPFFSKSPLELLSMHIHRQPVPPIEIVPEIGQALNECVLRALAKNPADRPQSAKQWGLELLAAVGITPVGVYATPTTGRTPPRPSISSPASPVAPSSAAPPRAPSSTTPSPPSTPTAGSTGARRKTSWFSPRRLYRWSLPAAALFSALAVVFVLIFFSQIDNRLRDRFAEPDPTPVPIPTAQPSPTPILTPVPIPTAEPVLIGELDFASFPETMNSLTGPLCRIGYEHLQENRLDKALQFFTRAIQIDRRNGSAHIGLARVLALQGNPELAIQWLKDAMEVEDVYFTPYETLQIPKLIEHPELIRTYRDPALESPPSGT